MGKHEFKIAPIPTALPTLKVAHHDENARLVAGLDARGERLLIGGQFLVAQNAAELDFSELKGFVVVQRDERGSIE
jgi:hypothetical protein